MKKPNIYIILALLIFMTMSMISQNKTETELFSFPVSHPQKSGKLILKQVKGSINVIGYEGSEVIIKASYNAIKLDTNSKKPDGNLRKISNGSRLRISIEENNNIFYVKNRIPKEVVDFEIKVPRNFDLKLSTKTKGNINVVGVSGEMELSNGSGDITAIDIIGTASADTTSGDINIVFDSVLKDASMAFSSYSGSIDITLPKNINANIKAKSEKGEVLTDFDVKMDANELPKKVIKNKNGTVQKIKIERWISGKINGGGLEILVVSHFKDIYIRAK